VLETCSGQGSFPAVLCYFQRKAEGYSVASTTGIWARQRHREVSTLMALIGEIKGRAVLDLGCGAGFYALRLADAGAQPVVAVDASPAMIAAISDSRIETVVGDAATVTLNRRFQLVLLAGLLEFVLDATAVLVNARRHLEPDGQIVALVPTNNFAGHVYRLFHQRHGFVITLFDRSRFAVMAKRAGLALVRSEAVFPFGDGHVLVPR
jgi:trans-aconitate methyltransferase